ncbi:MAG: DUF4326 domain-containing protein [Magnetococcales bacterium]|nr:DUF4326 domain-containing protein [Magnetococcales bacterium]
MNKVLILYPAEFNCYPKFARKTSRILQNLKNYSVVFPADANHLIRRYFENLYEVSLIEHADWNSDNISHAIIFDDGEVFTNELKILKAAEIKIREIHINVTRVINIKKEKLHTGVVSTSNYEYIGRGSYWGNPYSMYEAGETRDEVIRKFAYDFECDKFPNKKKSEVYKLAGKRLGCFCKPEACHGDVLANYLNSWDDGK